jgi:putative ABC transport system substrate-binding protein
MKRREFIALVGAATAAWPLAARAQTITKRVGVLMPESASSADTKARVAVFETTLKELGWISGRNIQIDYRFSMGDVERTREFAAERVNLAPDALVAVATPSMAAMRRATNTIPIVFVGVSEPVANGFVPSLAHPGGNVTGFSNLEPSFGAKWLELLKKIAPQVSRVAVIFNLTTGVTTEMFVRALEAAAPRFSTEAIRHDVHSTEDIEIIMKNLPGDGSAGLIFPPDPFTTQNRKSIAELANRYRLPAVYTFRSFIEAGGLASYGTNFAELFRPAAEYINRILKGENPGDLPVRQPTKFQLVINLKTAKALGLSVPQSLIAIADEVIE